MKATKFTVSPFVENTYIAWDEDTRHAVIIDPGMMQDSENKMIEKFIDDNHLVMQEVLLTHIHIDHVTGARWVADRYGIPVAASAKDQLLAQYLSAQAQFFRLMIPVENLKIDHELQQGDTIMLGKEKLEVLETPGHSAGGLIFYAPDSGLAFAGDTIFQGSIGRTDLPGGNFDTLITSIHEKVFTLPPETLLLPGHGEPTTVADEQATNPYLT